MYWMALESLTGQKAVCLCLEATWPGCWDFVTGAQVWCLLGWSGAAVVWRCCHWLPGSAGPACCRSEMVWVLVCRLLWR